MINKLRLPFLSLLLAGALLAGCGGGDGGAGEPVTEDGPATLAPASSVFYGEATLQPDSTRADAINSIAARFGAPGDVGDLIISELEKSAAAEDFELDFETDIQPWLGERAGVFVTEIPAKAGDEADPDAASPTGEDAPVGFAIEVTDTDAAQAFLDRAIEEGGGQTETGSFEGVDFTRDPEEDISIAIFGDFILAGNPPAFEAAILAAGDDSLATADTYSAATAKLELDSLASFFLNTEELVRSLDESGQIDSDGQAALDIFGDSLSEPVVGSLDATEDSVFFDVIAKGVVGVGAETTPLLAELPEDSSVALGINDLGTTLTGIYDSFRESESAQADELGPQIDQAESALGIDIRDEVLGIIGDVAIFVSGEDPSNLQVGAIIETTDAAGAGQLVDQLSGLIGLSGQGGPAPKGADSGFTAGAQGGAVGVATVGDRVVIAFTPAGDASGILGQISGSKGPDLGAEDLGDGFEPAGFIDLARLLPLADIANLPIDAEAAQILDNLERLVFGSKAEGDDVRSRTLLKLSGE